jgi:hypothetical protein
MALSRIRSFASTLLASLVFAARFISAASRGRPLRIEPVVGSSPLSAHLTPRGRFMPGMAGGAPEEDEDKDKGEKEKDKGDEDKDKGGEGDDDKVTPDDDWKSKSRKNETRAKKAERELAEEREEREKREESEKSDHQKALDKAKKEGQKEAETAAEKERKGDRLEVAVTRLASKKIKVGEGDDAKEVRFADTEDAQLHIERAIAKGEIDEDDIFDKDGKVKTDALQSELVQLLERKPHLRDGGTEGSSSPGDPDTGKGEAAKSDLESMTPDDHAKRKYGDSQK